MVESELPASGRIIGRYVLCSEVASGGMATVHLGKLLGPAGFSRVVAIKRLHPPFAKDPEFVSMFLDEARLAARIRHTNVVSVLDVVARDAELFLVMDYVHGESLARLLRVADSDRATVPVAVALGIIAGVLRGLHAAHEARGERGDALEIVHRDISPHNILVGTDGIASVVDFGVAKAATRFQTTREGQLKGKLSYMAPEQIRLEPVDRRTDVYSASVVLWEVLTGRRLITSDNPGSAMASVLAGQIEPPSHVRPEIPPELDAVVLKGLANQPSDRYPTARDMAVALEGVAPQASASQIGEWVEHWAEDSLRARAAQVADMESSAPSTSLDRPRPVPEPRALPEAPTRIDARRVSWPDAGAETTPEEPGLSAISGAETAASQTPVDAPSPTVSDAGQPRTYERRERRWLVAIAATLLVSISLALLLRPSDRPQPVVRQRTAPAEARSPQGQEESTAAKLPGLTPLPSAAGASSAVAPASMSPSNGGAGPQPATPRAVTPSKRRGGPNGSLSFDGLTRQ